MLNSNISISWRPGDEQRWQPNSNLTTQKTVYAAPAATPGYPRQAIISDVVIVASVERWSAWMVTNGLAWSSARPGRKAQTSSKGVYSRGLTVTPPTFFSLQGGKDKSKQALIGGKCPGGDRLVLRLRQADTTWTFEHELMHDCLSFPNEEKKIAHRPGNIVSDQAVKSW